MAALELLPSSISSQYGECTLSLGYQHPYFIASYRLPNAWLGQTKEAPSARKKEPITTILLCKSLVQEDALQSLLDLMLATCIEDNGHFVCTKVV